MEWIVLGGAVVFVVLLFAYPALRGAYIRRRRVTEPDYTPPRPLAVVDELYRPDAYAASQIAEAEQVIPARAPASTD